jgi:hypothetical protein
MDVGARGGDEIELSRVIPCLSDFGDEILLSGGEL